MFIREIGLYNFGVYVGPETIIPCTSHQGGQPITLIGGVNGAGKTTILEAVLLALYGKNSPALRESGQTYQNYIERYMRNDTRKEAWVELLLEVPIERQKVNLRIRRQWQRKKSHWQEELRITRNDVPDLYLAKNWVYYVEDLIPSGLAGLFFFDGEKIINMAKEETDEAMKKAIYSVFGVDIVDRLVLDMGRLIKRHEKNLYPAKIENEIYHLEYSGQELLDQLNVVRQDLAGIDARLERLFDQARQKEEQILRSGGSWQEERQKLVERKDFLKEKMADTRSKMIALAGGALPMALITPLLINLKDQMRHDQASKIASQALPLLDEQGTQIIDMLLDGGAENDLVKRIQVELARRKRELSDLANRISPLYMGELVLNQIEQLIDQGRLCELTNKAATLINQYQEIENELEQVERHLLVEVDPAELEREMQEYRDIQNDITSLSVKRQVLSNRLTELNNKFTEIERKHQTLLRQHLSTAEKQQDSTRIIEYAMRTKDTMNLFREKLIKRKAERLSANIQEAFQYLAHKKSLVDKVVVDPLNLNIRLYDKNGVEVSKQRLAAGEKQILAISLLWGLARSSGRMLPVIIDTPLGRLDASHRQAFVTRYLPAASHQVIVLSTDTEINGELYELLHQHVGQEYYLEYSDQRGSTIIRQGYFQSRDNMEEDYDNQTNQVI